MELPLFERAVLIIKKFETLHDSRRHWPYLAMVIENYLAKNISAATI